MKHIKQLAIFDFDQTICQTPLPEKGKLIYQEKTGNPWQHQGWWSKPESLDMDIFDIQPIESVLEEYEKEILKDDCAIVLLTGRLEKLRPEVMKILNHYNLIFDDYLLSWGGPTDTFKVKAMNRMLEKYKKVESVTCWDDRVEHIPIFQEWGKQQIESGRLKEFKLITVPSEEY